MSYRLTFRRPGELMMIIRKYRIEVDGKPVASLARSKEVGVTVSDGTHVVTACIDWVRSEPFMVEGKDGQDIVLEISGDNPFGILSSQDYFKIKTVAA